VELSLLGRHKRERGRGARTWEKNGVLGASPQYPSPSFLLPFSLPVYACYAGYVELGCFYTCLNSNPVINGVDDLF